MWAGEFDWVHPRTALEEPASCWSLVNAGDALVIATDYATAGRLRGERSPLGEPRESTCLYFDAPAPPIRGPWVVLNGDAEGPIRTLCLLSEVAPSYSSPGRTLVSVSLSDRLSTPAGDISEPIESARPYRRSTCWMRTMEWCLHD